MNSKQQPLEMSPGMSITMVVVMLIGWMGWANLPEEQSTLEQLPPIIQRITDRAIELKQFSIVIQPTAGWIYLEITNQVQADPTFVNPKGNAVVEFLPAPSDVDPPEGRQVQYDHLEIVWTSTGDGTRHEGWILHERAKLRIRAITGGGDIDADPAITALCNSIQPIQ